MPGISRREFGLGLGMAAAAAMSASEAAEAQLVWAKKDWDESDFHKVLTEELGDTRQVFDITSPEGLGIVKNALNGLEIGFDFHPSRIRTVAGLHGPANFVTLNDTMWAKYRLGEFAKITDEQTGKAAIRNPFYKSQFSPWALNGNPSDLNSAWHDASVEGLQHRGVKFFGCHTALEFQVRELVKERGLSDEPETIVREMLANLVPGAKLVASMASALVLLQSFAKYAYVKL